MRAIESETEWLDKRIRDLLYLTKLIYLSAHGHEREPVNLFALMQDAAHRLRWRKPELEWSFETQEVTMQTKMGHAIHVNCRTKKEWWTC